MFTINLKDTQATIEVITKSDRAVLNHVVFADRTNDTTVLSISDWHDCDYIEVAVMYDNEIEPISRFSKDVWLRKDVTKAHLHLFDKNSYYRQNMQSELPDLVLMSQSIADSKS